MMFTLIVCTIIGYLIDAPAWYYAVEFVLFFIKIIVKIINEVDER